MAMPFLVAFNSFFLWTTRLWASFFESWRIWNWPVYGSTPRMQQLFFRKEISINKLRVPIQTFCLWSTTTRSRNPWMSDLIFNGTSFWCWFILKIRESNKGSWEIEGAAFMNFCGSSSCFLVIDGRALSKSCAGCSDETFCKWITAWSLSDSSDETFCTWSRGGFDIAIYSPSPLYYFPSTACTPFALSSGSLGPSGRTWASPSFFSPAPGLVTLSTRISLLSSGSVRKLSFSYRLYSRLMEAAFGGPSWSCCLTAASLEPRDSSRSCVLRLTRDTALFNDFFCL